MNMNNKILNMTFYDVTIFKIAYYKTRASIQDNKERKRKICLQIKFLNKCTKIYIKIVWPVKMA